MDLVVEVDILESSSTILNDFFKSSVSFYVHTSCKSD